MKMTPHMAIEKGQKLLEQSIKMEEQGQALIDAGFADGRDQLVYESAFGGWNVDDVHNTDDYHYDPSIDFLITNAA